MNKEFVPIKPEEKKDDIWSEARVEIAGMSFDDLVDDICSSKDEAEAENARAVFDGVNVSEILESIIETSERFSLTKETLSGFVFEYLVKRELGNKNELPEIDILLQRIMQRPEVLNLDLSRRPDFFIVKKVADQIVVTDIFEVKMSGLGKKKRDQLRNIYKNVELVVNAINVILREMKVAFDVKEIPDEGIMLLPENEVGKRLVMPDGIRVKGSGNLGWRRYSSIFSQQDVRKMTEFLSDFFGDKFVDKLLSEQESKRFEAGALETKTFGEVSYEMLKDQEVGDLKVGDGYSVLPGRKFINQIQNAKEIKIAGFMPDNRVLLITEDGFTMRTRLKKLDRNFKKVDIT